MMDDGERVMTGDERGAVAVEMDAQVDAVRYLELTASIMN